MLTRRTGSGPVRLARTSRSCRRTRGEAGVSALELALIAPSLLLLIFLTIQGALYFYGKNVAIQAAREGASQLRLTYSEAGYAANKEAISASTERYADTVGRQGLYGTVATPSFDDDTGRVTMTVTGNVITLVPLLTLTVTQRAEGPVDRFQGPEGCTEEGCKDQ